MAIRRYFFFDFDRAIWGRSATRSAYQDEETLMMKLRRAQDRGHAEYGWLNSWHSFSFAEYYDPEHLGFRALRVINDDTVEPGRGFGEHGHRDMEIVSYVLEGGLAHKDSTGNGSIIRPGSVQRMSTGTGIRHSEFNASQSEKVHFLQIWFLPNKTGISPGYEEKHFDEAEKRGRLRLVASPDGADSSATLQADAKMFAGLVDGQERVKHVADEGSFVYVHVARGAVSLNGIPLQAGDAGKFTGERNIVLDHGQEAEVLVFELT